jgi:hypothetical protein
MPRNGIGIGHLVVYRTLLVEGFGPVAQRQFEILAQVSVICFEMHAVAAADVVVDSLPQCSLQFQTKVEEVESI